MLCGDYLLGHREGKGRTPKLNPTHFTRKSQSQSKGWQIGRVEHTEAGMEQVLNAEPQVCF